MYYEQVSDFKWELMIFCRVFTVYCHPCLLLLVDVLSNSRFIAEIEWKLGKILVIHTNISTNHKYILYIVSTLTFVDSSRIVHP